VSGDEGAVRGYIARNIRKNCDGLKTDAMGNLIAFKKGRGAGKVLLLAHMDEVGLVVRAIDDKGFLKFHAVGGIDPRVLLSKPVLVGADAVRGVTGCKPVHLQSPGERQKAPDIKDMYIDIGAKSREEAAAKVSEGDYVSFDAAFRELGDGLVKAKALDDRAGCAVLMEALKSAYDVDLYCAFTVQEEVGLRGAQTVSWGISPDVCVVIEATFAADGFSPGAAPREYATRLGGGAALSLMDSRAFYDRGLTAFLAELAKTRGVKTQYKQSVSGGNDAGAVQLAKGGVKTAAISLPARYIHSMSSVMRTDDYAAVKALTGHFLKEAAKCWKQSKS
jgi:endoglucanase